MARLDSSVTYKMYGEYDEIAYTPNPSCFVIVTARSFLWTLLTLGSTLLVITSILTPQWLVGKARLHGLRSEHEVNGSVYDHQDRMYHPTLGIINRCTRVHGFGDSRRDQCGMFVTGFDMPSSEFPNTWKSSLIFLAVAVVLLSMTVVTSAFSMCVRSIFRKSIFTVSGLIQSIAGLFLIIGLALYPAGWGEDRVKRFCGDQSSAFYMDECSFGWAFYTCIAGTVLVFVCSMVSIQAEVSTSSDKVENEIMEGKNVICLL